MAKRRKRCIVFLDEAQDLFMKRGGHRKFDDDTQNMLLAVLDGVRSKHRGRDHLDRRQQLQQRDHADGRGHAAPLPDEGGFPPAQPGRAPGASSSTTWPSARTRWCADLDLRHLVEVTEGRSPADLETIVNQAGITAVQAGEMIDADTLMQAAERVLVGNVNANTTKERERDRRIIAIHEWGHFLVDFEHGAQAAPAATGSRSRPR